LKTEGRARLVAFFKSRDGLFGARQTRPCAYLSGLWRTFVFLFLFSTAETHAGWTETESRTEPSTVVGVVHQHVVMQDPIHAAEATLELARFSPKNAQLALVDNPDGRDLAQAMKSGNYLAGVNGGYFDENFKPMGLRILKDNTTSPLLRGRLMTGVVVSSPSATRILRTAEFSKARQVSAAIQSGPFLVDRGRTVPGLESTRAARRTFVATTNSEAVLGFCSEVTLAQLSAILADGSEDLKIRRALNLDGGSSSAFWFRHKDGTAFSISEYKHVRDFVAITAR
jgi:uncharacterized protein YigE (DUF2233 family)